MLLSLRSRDMACASSEIPLGHAPVCNMTGHSLERLKQCRAPQCHRHVRQQDVALSAAVLWSAVAAVPCLLAAFFHMQLQVLRQDLQEKLRVGVGARMLLLRVGHKSW